MIPFDAEKISIHRVDIVSAVIDNPLEIASYTIDSFKLNFSFEIGFAFDNKLVKAELEINICTEVENWTQQATGKFKLAFLFSVENYDELVQLIDNNITVNDDLALAVASVTYSTTRGILLTRFQGTVFREFILPIISPIHILGAK